MKSEETALLELISDYASCAKYSCGLFGEIYNGDETLLYAYKVLRLIPKEGRIDGIYYNFHGRGCYFEYSDGSTIDIDFGPDGRRCDGFDLYRIESFLQGRTSRYPLFTDNYLLSEAFASLIKKAVIAKHPNEPTGHLYYLASELSSLA